MWLAFAVTGGPAECELKAKPKSAYASRVRSRRECMQAECELTALCSKIEVK